MLTGPNLGYSVSGQRGSTQCFRGSERFVSCYYFLFLMFMYHNEEAVTF